MQRKGFFTRRCGFRVGVLTCLIGVGCLAGTAHAADRVYHATYEGSYSYKATLASSNGTFGLHRHAVVDDEDLLRVPGRRITRSLVAHGSHRQRQQRRLAPSTTTTARSQSGPAASLPITLFIGDTRRRGQRERVRSRPARARAGS